MVPYEYLLSESQERMLFVAHKGREKELLEIFWRWGLQAVVAGKVIEEPIVNILFQGISKALSTPALKVAYEDAGNIITPSQSPQAFAAYMNSENKKWAEIIRLTGISGE
jgi:phosphoribosylformylglycinamidine (FGAM) synthase-like enzyme